MLQIGLMSTHDASVDRLHLDGAPFGQTQVRHDLINAINVLIGVAAGLRSSELTDGQRGWVRMLESSTSRLTALAEALSGGARADAADRQAQFADLCSIAAARVGKPFDRQRLLETIDSVADGKTRRILLVDDSPELVQVVRSYLDGTPWVLDDVESGERAVARAAAEHYDVVLMDIDLPGLDGTAAAHAIRAADLARGASPTPIIAMTAFDPGNGVRDQDP
jgi:CheY-like chemotaxis protein